MTFRFAAALAAALTALAATALPLAPAQAESTVAPRDGWEVIVTDIAFDALVARTQEAVKTHKMGLVTQASASQGAKGAGITIPGNRVIGVYRNDFARRMLAASVPAGIEAPIRLYLSENPDGGSTLSYKTPTTVFSPYFNEGGDDLRAMAAELDEIFATIAATATE